MRKILTILQKAICFIFIILSHQTVFSQYRIYGYLETDEPGKTIYLSLLRFDEENSQSENQIITSVRTDSTGYFEMRGDLLSRKDKFYRIYANISEETLDFIRTADRKNYHNFIFSNSDTIYFPKNYNDFWFQNAQNTNHTDKEWGKVCVFYKNLIKELDKNKNPNAILESKDEFVREFKSYLADSVSSSLVKVLAYSKVKSIAPQLEGDFARDPDYYYDILAQLKNEYGETSYYAQFREELGFLSYKKTKAKYIFHRNVNYMLLFLMLALLLFVVMKSKRGGHTRPPMSDSVLTQQEKKITDLMLKGLTNKEIASTLFISLSTVKTHITNIYSKLNVSNRPELIEKMKNRTGD